MYTHTILNPRGDYTMFIHWVDLRSYLLIPQQSYCASAREATLYKHMGFRLKLKGYTIPDQCLSLFFSSWFDTPRLKAIALHLKVGMRHRRVGFLRIVLMK